MSNILIPPFIIYFLGAALLPFLKGKARQVWLLTTVFLGLFSVIILKTGQFWRIEFLDFEIVFLNVDKISIPFGYVFSIITIMAVIYSFYVKNNGELVFALIYAGSSLGVVFSGDFISLFVFWEIMAIASTMLILYRNKKSSFDAAIRYIVMHVLGGSLLLGGIVYQFVSTNSVGFIVEPQGISKLLLLLGIGLNTGFVGLHTWLPDAYPKATFGGAVFMASLTTKVGVYALIRVFGFGGEIVTAMGALMIIYGIVFALMQTNVRKLLSYHIVSQVGYMVVAVGIGSRLAINGSIAHVINHILYKSLLFMCAGSLIYSTGKQSINNFGGIFRRAPIVSITCLVASLSIAGFPGFNGYISKEMIKLAALEKHMLWLEIILILGTVGTILSFLKLSYYIFFGTKKEVHFDKMPMKSMNLSMISIATLCVILGVYPFLLYKILPYQESLIDFSPFKVINIISTLQLFSATFASFFIFVKLFKPTGKKIADLDYIYQKIIVVSNISGEKLYGHLKVMNKFIYDKVSDILLFASEHLSTKLAIKSKNKKQNNQLKITSAGSAVMIVISVFVVYLLIYIIYTI